MLEKPLKYIGICILLIMVVLISLELWNYALWTIVICLLLFLLLCIVALVIENCSYKKFRNTFCKKIYKNIDQVYSNYPHAVIKYCRVHDIRFSRDKYDYKLKDALEISKVNRDIWKNLEKDELQRINNEYDEVKSRYPFGLSAAIEKFRTDNKEFLLINKPYICEQQQLHDEEAAFNKWIKEQKTFTNKLCKVSNLYGTETYVTKIGLSKKVRTGGVINRVYEVIYCALSETTTSNDIDINSLPLSWKLLRESISGSSNVESEFFWAYLMVNLVQSINMEFDNQVTFVVGDINSISGIAPNHTSCKAINLISQLQSEGIKAITIDQLINTNTLSSNKIIIISEVIESKRLREVIKELQNLKPYENLCIGCIASIINYGTAMARKRIDEDKKIKEAMSLISDFNTAIQNRSIDDIKRLYAVSKKLIDSTPKHPLISRGFKTIEDKYSEFEKEYSEGIIIKEGIEISTVNYPTPTAYQHIDKETYWNVKFPKFGTSIFPYRRRKVNRRGYSEEFFEDLLSQYLSNTTIVTDAALRISENIQYEPDIAIISDKNYHIHIDIEIDEPYSGYDRKPIHYKNNLPDLYRDQYLTNAGWIVVRFAEEQIIKSPLNCILLICRLLHIIDSTYIINQSLFTDLSNSVESYKPISKWSIEESQNMAAENYREKYLNISSFGKVENEGMAPQDYRLSEVEKRLSSELPSINHESKHNNIDIITNLKVLTPSTSIKQTSKEDSNTINLAKDCVKPSMNESVAKEHVKLDTNAKILSIGQIMQYYFKGINHKHIASLKSQGDKKLENSILISLEVEEMKRDLIYNQIQNIPNDACTTCFKIQHRGQRYDDIDISRELALIRQFMQEQGNYPEVAGMEIIDMEHSIKTQIGCIYGNKLYDFYLDTEYYGGDWGKSVLAHIGDVPNERNDMIASIKAFLVEQNLGISIKEIYTITIDTNKNDYRSRRVRRRTSEVQRLLKEILLNPLKV